MQYMYGFRATAVFSLKIRRIGMEHGHCVSRFHRLEGCLEGFKELVLATQINYFIE